MSLNLFARSEVPRYLGASAMTNWTLAKDYFRKSLIRRKALNIYYNECSYDDVIRESQELVELLLKGVLRLLGVDPPKWHDVGQILEENVARLPNPIQVALPRICKLSSMLRKERELSFYGDDDFIPSQHYSKEDAEKVLTDLDWLIALVDDLFKI